MFKIAASHRAPNCLSAGSAAALSNLMGAGEAPPG